MLRWLAARSSRLRPLLPAAAIVAGWPASCTKAEAPLVAFLGDSLTSGWRLSEEEAYPALLARALAARGRSVRVLNAGVSGDTAARALARLPEVLKHRPDVLVVTLGANDVLGPGPLEPTQAALEQVVIEGRAAGAAVLLVGIRMGVGPAAPRVGERAGDAQRAERLLEIQAGLAATHRVAFVPDLLAGVAGEADLLFPDRLHPNAAGQRRLAENVLPQLELVLAEVESGRR